MPYLTKSTETALNQVPSSYGEGAEALGLPTTWGCAGSWSRPRCRGSGPLLLTANWSFDEPSLQNVTNSPVGYLTYPVWTFFNSPYKAQQYLAYDAALLLFVLVHHHHHPGAGGRGALPAQCGMTADRGDDVRRAGGRRPVSAGVLADRMAATLVHHEPGWRLPRLTAMARRYNVSAAEVDAAVEELAARHLLRRLPDGQVYRASPAEYRIPLEGLSGLASQVDPMGGQLACKSRHVSRRRPPEDIGRSLGLEAGEPVLAVRCVWTVGGEPAALSASYLPEHLAQLLPDLGAPPFGPLGDRTPVDGLPGAGTAVGGTAVGGTAVAGRAAGGPAADGPAAGADAARVLTARARALQVELAPPPSSVARSLRLGAGELVATVTAGFEDQATGRPVAITTAMLRPDLFRIVIQATAPPAPAGPTDRMASVWTHDVQGWEP